jgi:hypothetical protein
LKLALPFIKARSLASSAAPNPYRRIRNDPTAVRQFQ